MMLLVGLGNPGQKYLKNRHNIGFTAIEKIASYYKFSKFQKKFRGKISEGKISGQKIIMLKPETFMNESGIAVQAIKSFFKINCKKIVVLHDDIDLALYQIKIKCGGGHAGHNGIKSIDKLIGKEYWRIRLGVGRPEEKEQVNKYVLSNFQDSEEEKYDAILDSVVAVMPELINGDQAAFAKEIAKKLTS